MEFDGASVGALLGVLNEGDGVSPGTVGAVVEGCVDGDGDVGELDVGCDVGT